MKNIPEYIIVKEVSNCKKCNAFEIDKQHRRVGWLRIGFHFVITEDGELESGRPLEDPGAHSRGFNSCSIGVGLCGEEHSEDQLNTLFTLVLGLLIKYPDIEVLNHPLLRDDDEAGFNAETWFHNILTAT